MKLQWLVDVFAVSQEAMRSRLWRGENALALLHLRFPDENDHSAEKISWLGWCEEGDLNPYAISGTSPSN